MRKIKKINGYLIVKFNDREKRVNEGTGLGEYGVIDAELYTGHLDADRDAMKCDNAGTLEAAVELARGLEAELDIIDEPATCTVVIESNGTFSEKEVDPQRMVNRWKERLEERIKDGHSPELNADTAAHELYGYQAALSELGFLSGDEGTIQPDIFNGHGIRTSPSGGLEEFLSSVCDNVCRYRPDCTQEELDIMCAGCILRRLASYQYQLSYLIKDREKEESRPYECPCMDKLRILLQDWQREHKAPYSALKLCFDAFLAAERKRNSTVHSLYGFHQNLKE